MVQTINRREQALNTSKRDDSVLEWISIVTLCVQIFEIGREEGAFLCAKTMHFVLHLLCKKQCTLCYVFIYNVWYSTDT